MTEKDYRALITSLELTKDDKDNIALEIENITNLLKNNVRNFDVLYAEKIGTSANSTAYHGRNIIDFMVVVGNCKNNSFPLMNQAVINEIWNIMLFEKNIEKTSQISFDASKNMISANVDNYVLNIYVRYDVALEYQNGFDIETEKKRIKFVTKANDDFKLFRNACQLIKYFKDAEGITKVDDYMIELFLYSGLCSNFTFHTYELYIKECIHAVEDFLKGIKIEQDDDVYRYLGTSKVPLLKKQYMLIDPANPKDNLTFSVGEAMLADLRKLKKALLKTFENNEK